VRGTVGGGKNKLHKSRPRFLRNQMARESKAINMVIDRVNRAYLFLEAHRRGGVDGKEGGGGKFAATGL